MIYTHHKWCVSKSPSLRTHWEQENKKSGVQITLTLIPQNTPPHQSTAGKTQDKKQKTKSRQYIRHSTYYFWTTPIAIALGYHLTRWLPHGWWSRCVCCAGAPVWTSSWRPRGSNLRIWLIRAALDTTLSNLYSMPEEQIADWLWSDSNSRISTQNSRSR